MSIQIITTETDGSRPTFTCDQCKRPIQPEEGLLLWDSEDAKPELQDSILVCRDCDTSEQLMSQELDTGLVYLLVVAGWIDEKTLKPTAKLLAAASRARVLASL